MIPINQLSPSELLLSHSSITPEIASAIVRNRPTCGYQNMRELMTRNSSLPDVWDTLEPLIEFQQPSLDLGAALNSVAQKYGRTPTPAPVKQNVAQLSDPLQQIRQRYAK